MLVIIPNIIGCRFEKNNIINALKDIDLTDYFGRITLEEVLVTIFY